MQPLEVGVPTVHDNRGRIDGQLSDDDSLNRDDDLDSTSGLLHDVMNVCTMDGEGSLRALKLVFVVSSTFALAQLLGSYFANSLSMYGDTLTMGLDAMTYALNIYAEKRKIASRNDASLETAEAELERLDTTVAVVSLLTLVGVTIYIIADAIARLKSEDSVNPVSAKIMLGFTSANLVMNFLTCSAFLRSSSFLKGGVYTPKKHHGVESRDLDADIDFAGSFLGSEASAADQDADNASREPLRGHEDGREDRSDIESMSNGEGFQENLNVMSAFIHLLADTARSITVFVTSIYVQSTGADPVHADAVSSIIVCVLILFAALLLCHETAKRCRSMRIRERITSIDSAGHSFEPMRSPGPSEVAMQ